MTGHIPDLKLERYVLGELPRAELERLARCEAEQPELAARVAALRASNAEILRALPPSVIGPAVRARVAPSRRWLGVGAGLVVAGAVLVGVFLAVPGELGGPAGPGGDGVSGLEVNRTKGEAALRVFRQESGGPKRVQDGEVAREGDLLQLSVTGAGGKYAALFSVDGRGVVTQHLPERGAQAVAVGAGELVLPHAYELDDAPGFETFYLVTGQEPFSSAPLISAVGDKAGEPLKLAAGQRVQQLRLKKGGL